ncbi:hypothetical protein CFK38_08815 [Brachybacterium vulturis]|uniref:Uncharacterized protein n=1 Tax=Brachybacterium vulturis TaxID=2017484 RepID=A0A291GN15_9MICO|nr:hypothetical protein [Brachybacterium vulturis]ATG51615.1 hypothetical protein CFK38_08815 [Brachybacterium vulturis]
MSHTLALWPGPSPADAASACREYSSEMIRLGIEWSRSGTIPSRNAAVMAFCREAARLLRSSPAGVVHPMQDPSQFGTLWGDMLTLELDGPQPLALATLAHIAEEHALVLFDLRTHRLLTTADVTTAFGEPMVPVPAQTDIVEQVTRCSQRWDCIDELRVLSSGLLNCSVALDPFLVTPIEEEYARFQQVLDLLGCLDLEDLRERLEELIHAIDDDPVR